MPFSAERYYAYAGLDQDEEPLIQLVDFNSATVTDDDACTIWDAGTGRFWQSAYLS